jgi:universal stress protein E
MATGFRRILVAIGDLRHTHRSTLRKVAALASGPRASIELYHAINEPVAVDSLRVGALPGGLAGSMEDVVRGTQRALQRLARVVPEGAARVSVHAEWDYPAHEAIVRRALAIDADLVVIERHSHRLGARLFLTNTDWELVRACPAPLLLVRGTRPYDGTAVIASLDPFHAHDKPAGLDRTVLGAERNVAVHLGADLHAFHAYLPLLAQVPMAMMQPVPMWLPPEAEQDRTQHIRRTLEKLAASAKIPTSRVHLRMGDVPSELADAARRNRAGIVVMGAISRSGLQRAFIGNTAERVLDELRSDVLVVKPRGFATRVPRRRTPVVAPIVY